MRPEGLGDLHMAFEKLKESLRARGYFDESNKRPLPRRPRSVGIATSATGAALQDMLSTINSRFPLLDVVFRLHLCRETARQKISPRLSANSTEPDLM
ncbi:MAG: hypothetical protein IPH49_04780 [Ignavibacteria bacterium]|nr:hypothetical protein [Ignavibacteria bacterium]